MASNISIALPELSEQIAIAVAKSINSQQVNSQAVNAKEIGQEVGKSVIAAFQGVQASLERVEKALSELSNPKLDVSTLRTQSLGTDQLNVLNRWHTNHILANAAHIYALYQGQKSQLKSFEIVTQVDDVGSTIATVVAKDAGGMVLAGMSLPAMVAGTDEKALVCLNEMMKQWVTRAENLRRNGYGFYAITSLVQETIYNSKRPAR